MIFIACFFYFGFLRGIYFVAFEARNIVFLLRCTYTMIAFVSLLIAMHFSFDNFDLQYIMMTYWWAKCFLALIAISFYAGAYQQYFIIQDLKKRASFKKNIVHSLIALIIYLAFKFNLI